MQTQDEVTQFNCSLPYFTNIPEDVVTNTWHMIFTGAGLPTVTDYGNAADNFKTFYDAVYATSGRGLWVGNVMTIKSYSLWLTPPHVPSFSATRTLAGAAAAGNAPTELSICLSYKAAYISGVAQARQRGRIYLGGFADPCIPGTGSSFPEVGPTQRTAIGAAGDALQSNMLADQWTWVVLSPTQVAAGGGAQETFDVTSGWVDNSPDTQRRRGFKTTARTPW